MRHSRLSSTFLIAAGFVIAGALAPVPVMAQVTAQVQPAQPPTQPPEPPLGPYKPVPITLPPGGRSRSSDR
jgi:hypothetical protein